MYHNYHIYVSSIHNSYILHLSLFISIHILFVYMQPQIWTLTSCWAWFQLLVLVKSVSNQFLLTVPSAQPQCVPKTHSAVLDTSENLKVSYLSRFCWEWNSRTFCQIPLLQVANSESDILWDGFNLAGAQLLSKGHEGGHLCAPQQKGDWLNLREGGYPTHGSKKKQLAFIKNPLTLITSGFQRASCVPAGKRWLP